MSDFEKLINASDLFDWIMETYPDWCVGAIRGIVDHIKKMPSAQPEVLACGSGELVQESDSLVQEVETMATANLTVPIIIDRKDIEESLAQLVKAQTQQWIPVSERLPEMPGWYLISKVDAVFDAYFSFDKGWEIESIEGFHPVENVLAWMPLPEPYQEVPHAT